jgi:hypothetical protein
MGEMVNAYKLVIKLSEWKRSLGSSRRRRKDHHHHHLQGSGLLACSSLPVRRIDPSISSAVDLYTFLLHGGNFIFLEGFCRLVILWYVRSNSAAIPLFFLLDWILKDNIKIYIQ